MLCRRWGSSRTVTGKVVWAEQNMPSSVLAERQAMVRCGRKVL
ncbi:Serine phosphatase RsbU, regulator of sigma subunit OS=Streptomyces microflavus OX=1919 GN=Smic_02940 PE=4 SV=1 [Streptomyces microflavus]